MSLFALVWLFPFALLAETPVALPELAADSHSEEVLRQYPLGTVSLQSALSAHGAPDRMKVFPNRLVGWAYSYEEGNAGAVPIIYTLVFDTHGQVVDVLYRRDADTMSALRLRGAREAAPDQAERGWRWHHMQGYGYGPHWGWGHGTTGLWWLASGIALVVFLGAVLVLLSRLARRARPRKDAALVILNERYARGELDREDFEQRRRALRS
ncbi:hypothetical protein THITH_08905 [Thioalkalivibrio paradoxus ARh 1]|uniref:SHOCT domain-containing protein n=1 Tax=Thioalkalivibrio paradoxus ARh 1 TaxID=713585 RepID=W0DIB0_9GAMM|nr:hypothetical protein THITH_08905 [Thioalkalivibrio paradoxus ARh 1]